MKKKQIIRLTVLLALAVVFCQVKVYATENAAESVSENATESVSENVPESGAENTTEKATESATEKATEDATENATENTAENETENVIVPTESKEIISLELPVVEERDPFSFFIDPLHIFYNTFGNSGGDITVEEDTYLLFHNRDEGGYTLSSRSDSLKITNKSTVPVKVTITAKLENADGISVMQEEAFEDRDSCDLYLALVDDEGNEQPLSADGEVSVTVNLDRAPLDAYAYVLSEDTGEYQYVYQAKDVAFDTYSFGLRGGCNGKGDWTGISGKPHVTISWNVEPIVSGEPETEEETESFSESSVSDNEASDMEEQGTEEPSTEEPSTEEPGTGEQTEDGDENSTENTVIDTEESTSENGETTGEGGSDSDSSDSGQEKEPEHDGSTDESHVTEEAKDETPAVEEGTISEGLKETAESTGTSV